MEQQQNKSIAGRPCTCEAPPLVDLTRGTSEQNKAQQQQLLLKNLTRCGWSHIRICSDTTTTDQESKVSSVVSSLLQQSPKEWKERLVSYFDDPEITQSSTSSSTTTGITFRAAESGKPGTVEPKRSLEVQRRRSTCETTSADDHHNNKSDGNAVLYEDLWGLTNVLHHVACTVREALDLPPQVFLEEKSSDADTIDLMRVFYYDAADRPDSDGGFGDDQQQQQAAATTTSLGSNAHTDWGSFTVVWQAYGDQDSSSVNDDCLQTYCHEHQKWIPVMAAPSPPTTQTSSKTCYWDFVVHVGDLTSISAGLGLERYSFSQQQKQHLAANESSDKNFPIGNHNPIKASPTSPISPPLVVWPSPCHRVVSPITHRRLSLVYFAYPPPTVSLDDMEDAMEKWWATHPLARNAQSMKGDNMSHPLVNTIPWDDYFILKNQSSSIDKETLGDNLSRKKTAHDTYQKIARLPVRQVLQEKWQQVQR
jgi:hypothetical protein